MTPPAVNNNAAVQAQIDSLGETMRAGFSEIKGILQGLDERMRSLERSEAGCYPLINQRLEALNTQLGSLDKQVKEHENMITELVHTNRVLKWIAGIMTAILTTMLIALATGQAAIVFH